MAYDQALQFAPNYVYALNNKGNSLQRLADLQAQLSKHEEAKTLYQLAIEAYKLSLSIVNNQPVITVRKEACLRALDDIQ